MKITEPQKWALNAIKDGFAASPASLGERMMDRPNARPEWRRGSHYKAQGYGRMGGTMLARLERKGLCIQHVGRKYQLTAKGATALKGQTP